MTVCGPHKACTPFTGNSFQQKEINCHFLITSVSRQLLTLFLLITSVFPNAYNSVINCFKETDATICRGLSQVSRVASCFPALPLIGRHRNMSCRQHEHQGTATRQGFSRCGAPHGGRVYFEEIWAQDKLYFGRHLLG
jgi:hypothetical protein